VGLSAVDGAGTAATYLDVVLISNAVPQAAEVRLAAAKETITVIFDSESMTTDGLVDLLGSISAENNGIEIGHLGIVTHGGEGQFDIGTNEVLSLDTLPGHLVALQRLRLLLSNKARLDVFACSVAGGVDGKTFVNALATATGADVYASDNGVGSGASGDFTWEYSTARSASGEELFSIPELDSIPGLLLSNPRIDSTSATSTVTQGGTLRINWATSGTVDHVGLYLINPSGAQVADIAIIRQADGSYNWTVPSNLGTGSGYRVKVVAWANYAKPDPRTSAFTNTFTISEIPRVDSASVNISSVPQGGTFTTTWRTSGTVDHVGLYLIDPVGNQIADIATRLPANGSYNWTIHQNLGSGIGYKVMVVAWASNTDPDPRVRSYTNTFSISVQVPSAPQLLGPSNGSTGLALPPRFGWRPVDGAETYRVVWSTDPNELPSDPGYSGLPKPAHGDTEATIETALTPRAPLAAGTTYYWKVHGGRPEVGGYWSPTNRFTTATSNVS